MAWIPIARTPIQYEKTDGNPANGYYLKFYLAATTTPTVMATDETGATQIAKCKLNERGFPISNPSDETTIFIPHVSSSFSSFRYVIYQSAADADANNLAAAIVNLPSVNQTIDVQSYLTGLITTVATYADISSALSTLSIGQQFSLVGHTVAGIGGGIFDVVSSASLTADNGTIVINGAKAAKRKYDYLTPEFFGSLGNGGDDTEIFNDILSMNKNVNTSPGSIYGLTGEVTCSSSGVTISGGGTIKFLSSYDKSGGTLSAFLITGDNVTIDHLTFDGSAVTGAATNNRFIWCIAPYLRVTSSASFLNLPIGGGNFNGAIGCTGLAPYARVIGAYFENNPGAIFVQGRNCVAANNVIVNPRDVAIALNGINCYGAVVIGNTINNIGLYSCSALIAAEEGASQWTIEGNVLFGVKDGAGISALNVAVTTAARGGKILGNVINGGSGTTTNPCALISHTKYYEDVDISNNLLFGCPTGNSNTRMIVAAASGGQVNNNTIDAEPAAGLGALVSINQGDKGILIKDNNSRAAAGVRHFLFGGGDYNSIPCKFIGGSFKGGAEGINSEFNVGTITNLQIHIHNIIESSATSIVNCPTVLGDRNDWLNAGAWARPHNIGVFTTMFCTAVPASGTFFNGDELLYLTPTFPGYRGLVRVAGAWKEFGALV